MRLALLLLLLGCGCMCDTAAARVTVEVTAAADSPPQAVPCPTDGSPCNIRNAIGRCALPEHSGLECAVLLSLPGREAFVNASLGDISPSPGAALNLTIIGNHTVVRPAAGEGSSRFLYITASPLLNIYIEDLVIQDFAAGAGSDGGALLLDSVGAVQLLRVSFLNNSADSGGSVHAGRVASASISSCLFQRSAATVSGGALSLCSGGDDTCGRVRILDCDFRHNTAFFGSAVHFLESASNVSIERSRFAFNVASDSAAVFLSEGSSAVRVADCEFSGNTAAYSAAALHVSYLSTDVMVHNCSFVNNTAHVYAGAMYLDKSTSAAVTACSFRNNSATWGGALSIGLYAADVSVTNSTFMYNVAWDGGGAVYLSDQSDLVLIQACTFACNVAAEGGAVFVRSRNYLLSLLHCHFEKNYATSQGGVVYLSSYNEDVTMVGNTFTGNYAPEGK
jgi:hypothetical protein